MSDLTELKTIYLNNDFAVRPDVNKRIRRIDFRRRRLIAFLRCRGKIEVKRHQQPAGGSNRNTQEASSAQVQIVVSFQCYSHGPPPLLQSLRRALDRLANAHIGATAAKIPA